jgi:hypothetical protein
MLNTKNGDDRMVRGWKATLCRLEVVLISRRNNIGKVRGIDFLVQRSRSDMDTVCTKTPERLRCGKQMVFMPVPQQKMRK